MARKMFSWLSVLVMIALLVAAVPAPGSVAQGAPPTVNGLFYGDDDDSKYELIGYAFSAPNDPLPYCGTSPAVTLYQYEDESTSTLYVAAVLSRCLNDNVFGDATADADYLQSANWIGQAHDFYQLFESDMMQFKLECYDSGGAVTDYFNWCHGLVYDSLADYDTPTADGDPEAGDYWASGPLDPNGGAGSDGKYDCSPATTPTGLTSGSSTAWNMNQRLWAGVWTPPTGGTGWDFTLGGAREDLESWKSPDTGTGAPNGPYDSVASVVVTNGGSGYSTSSSVTFDGDCDPNPEGTVQVADGVITAIILVGGGSGYTGAGVSIESSGAGSGATATALFDPFGQIMSIHVDDGGSGYEGQEYVPVTISDNATDPGSGAEAIGIVKTKQGVTRIDSIFISKRGSGYNQWNGTTGTTAAISGNAQLGIVDVGDGVITDIDVWNGGSGYAPGSTIVTIDGDGIGATAGTVSTVDGVITGVNLTSEGSGCTSPTVSFGTPGSGAEAIALQDVVTDEEGYPPSGPITYDSTNRWEWPIVYEWSLDLDTACTAGYDSYAFAYGYSHNSPTKGGGEDPLPLAVDLLWFKAKARSKWAMLSWETASESNNLGFYLWRATSLNGDRTQVNADIIPSKVTQDGGGASYKYKDTGLEKKTTYYYWLQDVDMEFIEGWSEPIEVTTR